MRTFFVFVTFAIFSVTHIAHAQEFTSINFRISAPVISIPGGYGASTNFQLYGALSQPAIGTSTITNFSDNSGFLYYPYVNAPVVTATAGDGRVVLTWTASTGALGWTVSSYNVGQSTSSGGPYSYTDVGNVLTSTRTGLTNGTTYYFVVRPEDAFGESIATSTEASATPQSAGGGGGGGDNGPPQPSPRPLFERIIRFITGERAPTEACEKRSDFNCDNRVNLQDLSILFARPAVASGRVLSYLFSDWTEPLPVPKPEPVLPGVAPRAPAPLRAFAQVGSIVAPQEPVEAEPHIVPPKRKTFLEVVVGIVRAVARAITQLFRR